MKKTTKTSVRNEQIIDDWRSGSWNLEELSYFWGMKLLVIAVIVRRVEQDLDKPQLIG